MGREALSLSPRATGHGNREQYKRIARALFFTGKELEFRDAIKSPKLAAQDDDCVEVSVDKDGRRSFPI
jgi:hypothetical protein